MTGEDRNDKSIPKCSERDESGLLELDESRVLEIEDHLSPAGPVKESVADGLLQKELAIGKWRGSRLRRRPIRLRRCVRGSVGDSGGRCRVLMFEEVISVIMRCWKQRDFCLAMSISSK